MILETLVNWSPTIDENFRRTLAAASSAYTRDGYIEWYSAVNLRYSSWMITPKVPLTPSEGHILIHRHLHPLFLHDVHDYGPPDFTVHGVART